MNRRAMTKYGVLGRHRLWSFLLLLLLLLLLVILSVAFNCNTNKTTPFNLQTRVLAIMLH
jgi:hypothetical protein